MVSDSCGSPVNQWRGVLRCLDHAGINKEYQISLFQTSRMILYTGLTRNQDGGEMPTKGNGNVLKL